MGRASETLTDAFVPLYVMIVKMVDRPAVSKNRRIPSVLVSVIVAGSSVVHWNSAILQNTP